MFRRLSAGIALTTVGLWVLAACGAETAIIGISTNGDTIEFQVVETGSGGIPTSVSQLSIEVGESVDILVNVLNPLATPVPTGQVSWTSDDPGTAAVTAGTITGVAVGSTTVYATALGVTASMPVQVTAAQTTQPPPTPGSFRNNMPNGWTIISDYGMDVEPMGGTAYYENHPMGDWLGQFWATPGGNMVRSEDPTAPFSPGFVLEEVYPPGLSGNGTTSWYRSIPSSDKVYISWIVKWDADFEHNGNSEKLIHFNLGSGFSNYFLFQFHWGNESIFNITSAQQYYSGDTSLYANVSPAGVTPGGLPKAPPVNGQWIEYELLFDRSTGTVRWWKDGILHAHHTGRTFSPIAFITIDTTWGGGGNKSGTHSRYTDHITVAVGS